MAEETVTTSNGVVLNRADLERLMTLLTAKERLAEFKAELERNRPRPGQTRIGYATGKRYQVVGRLELLNRLAKHSTELVGIHIEPDGFINMVGHDLGDCTPAQ